MNARSDRDSNWRNLDENQNQQWGVFKMEYNVLFFFGMKTECCMFPPIFNITKTWERRQIDIREELEKMVN